MLKLFNSLQIVTLFAAMPYIIGWLHGGPFVYSTGALWLACAVYVAMFIGIILAVDDAL